MDFPRVVLFAQSQLILRKHVEPTSSSACDDFFWRNNSVWKVHGFEMAWKPFGFMISEWDIINE